MRLLTAGLLVSLLGVLFLAPAGGHAATPLPCGALAAAYDPAAPPAYRHVIVIMDENASEPTVIGSAAAPYLTGLAASCALATQYHAATHPSQPNYMALAAGQFPPYAGGPQTSGADNLFHQAQAAGDSWRSYQESMANPCNLPSSPLPYYKGHDPAQWFTDLRGTGAANTCKRFDVPISALDSAIAGDTGSSPVDGFPTFAWVSPDKCHDMHWDAVCSEPRAQRIAAGDAWLGALIPRLTATDAYQRGQMLILITWDEGNAAKGVTEVTNTDCTSQAVYTADPSCRVALIAVSPYVAPGTASANPAFNHYAATRTIEDILGYPALARAATSPDMRAALHF